MSNSVVQVEVILMRRSNIDSSKLEPSLDLWLRKSEHQLNGVAIKDFEGVQELSDNVEYVVICDDDSKANTTHIPSVNIRYR